MDNLHASVAAVPTDWLLGSELPWVRYWTLVDLLGYAKDSLEAVAAHEATVEHPAVKALVNDLLDWPGPELKRHNDAGHPVHKLALLADMGFTAADALLQPVIDRVLAHQSEQGAFTINLRVHERFGGDGEIHTAWMLCDAPLPLYALLAFGLGDHPQVERALEHLAELVWENGWPCATAPEFGKFRGPGRKLDPCPYATLVALKALSRAPAYRSSIAAKSGVGMLLWHWEHQKERKLYLFGVGTDYRKPKYPLVWYDILHVTAVLSRFPSAWRDPRFQTMLAELMAQVDEQGRLTAQSMYRAWQGWDFADKKTPSPTITATAWRAWQRAQP
ncbi:hypothetical protein ACFLYO_03815 [Chloroflexota bacterium]